MRLWLLPIFASLAAPVLAAPACQQPPAQVPHGEARLSVVVDGSGPPVLMIPSLGRGLADFDVIARDLVAGGNTVIRYDPRWFGASTGPAEATLDDLAGDARAVAAAACPGEKVTVIGHALGNRIARAMAAADPDRIASIILLAAGGQVPIPREVEEAIGISAAQGELPDEQRLTALQLAFFAPGQDAALWLTGWDPDAARLQASAVRATRSRAWVAAGGVPLLVIQPMRDPVAPLANGTALVGSYQGQAVMVQLDHASHAILPEQPVAVSALVKAWLAGMRDGKGLQRIADERVVQP
ncbi:alpha/beta fold hydrolase [Erythrobacter sp. BLCC-B19]|uniref:alpha/beta fold hydrolase n=1 Tax=Erythrobacter sp. BLCC-B19 TaxID=3025315 RepID=UPI00235EBCC8|nr:alpha/beta hydrolase [Erythrobacter sp. BLCC-B19]WDA39633.1 alpha/beta hydrolase [Erythrobacter sp. BLCC-B19]